MFYVRRRVFSSLGVGACFFFGKYWFKIKLTRQVLSVADKLGQNGNKYIFTECLAYVQSTKPSLPLFVTQFTLEQINNAPHIFCKNQFLCYVLAKKWTKNIFISNNRTSNPLTDDGCYKKDVI